MTTADLATVESRTAKCAALGGTYTPADTIATQASALAEGLTKPIEERFNLATASNTTLTVAGRDADDRAQRAQDPGLRDAGAATPIKLTVASAKAKTVASKGAVVTVSAQAQKAVKVTVSLTEAAGPQAQAVVVGAGQEDRDDRREPATRARRSRSPRPRPRR